MPKKKPPTIDVSVTYDGPFGRAAVRAAKKFQRSKLARELAKSAKKNKLWEFTVSLMVEGRSVTYHYPSPALAEHVVEL